MKTNILNLLILVFFLFSLSCYDFSKSYEKKQDSNYIKLFNVNIKEFKNKEMTFSLNSDYLLIDRDRAEVYLDSGVFTSELKNKNIRDRLEVIFNKGNYNFKTKQLSLILDEGFLVDNDIKIFTKSIEYDALSGFLRTEGSVKIIGGNFTFEGRGFSGNIKDGIFAFNEGITAKVFK